MKFNRLQHREQKHPLKASPLQKKVSKHTTLNSDMRISTKPLNNDCNHTGAHWKVDSTITQTRTPTSSPISPTIAPSQTKKPNSQPTGQPTGQPSAQPSMQPTGQPTRQPTLPSGQPSGQPTMRPTGQPTSQPSAFFVIPIGVVHNYPQNILHVQCTVCFAVPYSSISTSAEISSCLGPYLFLGALYGRNTTFLLGAFGAVADVQTFTPLNIPHLVNGVYFYKTRNESFGFSDNPSIFQDQGDTATTDPQSRLSWHMDTGTGGYRAGAHLNLNFDDDWQKWMYNCPGKIFIRQYLRSQRKFI